MVLEKPAGRRNTERNDNKNILDFHLEAPNWMERGFKLYTFVYKKNTYGKQNSYGYFT